MDIRKHFDLLGKKAKDKVTGFTGVITTLSFDLYGCIQVVVEKMDKDNKTMNKWFDVVRLEIKDKKPIIEPPKFLDEDVSMYTERVQSGHKGPAEKPLLSREIF